MRSSSRATVLLIPPISHHRVMISGAALRGGLLCLALLGCSPTGPRRGAGKTSADGGPACAAGDIAQMEATCVCQTFSDCEAGNSATWACSNAHSCLQTCVSAADCVAAPDTVCEDALCRPSACGTNSECPSGQLCIAASCVPAFPATSVAACQVLPSAAVLNAGGARSFRAISYDSKGNEIAYEGTATFAVSGVTGITATPSPTISTLVTVAGSPSLSGGAASLSATIGTTVCRPAVVATFAAPPANTLRVTVVDQLAGTPLTGAVVVDGNGNTLTPGGDGTYTEAAATPPAARNTFSAFLTGYTYVTIFDTAATDVFIPLKAAAAPATFDGSLAATDFDNLSNPTGTVHLDISGASIPGNLSDVTLADLMGLTPPLPLENGFMTPQTTINLPDGVALGIGPMMFKGTYSVQAIPGLRAFWSLGGNLPLQLVLNAESGMNPGALESSFLSSLGPAIGELESGVTGGAAVTAGESGTLTTSGTTSGTNAVLAPQTLQRLHLSATLPNLPGVYYVPADTAGMPTGQLDGAAIVGGVLASPQGFIPLGLTGSAPDPQSPQQISGNMGGPDGVLPLRLAPRSGGLEGFPYVAIAVAADMESLAAGNSTVTGNVILLGELAYDNGGTTSIAFPGGGGATPTFLGFPSRPLLTIATRQLAMPAADVPQVAYHRLDIGRAPNQWEIYFPAGEQLVQVPPLPAGFSGSDVLAQEGQDGAMELQSVTLGLNGDNSRRVYSFDEVVGFQSAGPTLDDLTLQMDQFSIVQVTVL